MEGHSKQGAIVLVIAFPLRFFDILLTLLEPLTLPFRLYELRLRLALPRLSFARTSSGFFLKSPRALDQVAPWLAWQMSSVQERFSICLFIFTSWACLSLSLYLARTSSRVSLSARHGQSLSRDQMAPRRRGSGWWPRSLSWSTGAGPLPNTSTLLSSLHGLAWRNLLPVIAPIRLLKAIRSLLRRVDGTRALLCASLGKGPLADFLSSLLHFPAHAFPSRSAVYFHSIFTKP